MFLIYINKVLSQIYTLTNNDWEYLLNLKYYHLKVLLNISVLTCQCSAIISVLVNCINKYALWLVYLQNRKLFLP